MTALETITEAVWRNGPNREAYRELGNVRAQVDGDYLILNYSEQAVYERGWTEIERTCRGLIFHWPTATIAARPFAKFFNLGEVAETQLESLPDEVPEVTVKMDGSLAVGFWYGDQYRIATRGSFVSTQAQWATAFVWANFDTTQFPHDTTLLFEIIYPENRIVLDYAGEQALYLIGAIRIADGYDHPYAGLQRIAAQHGFKLVPRADFADLSELIAMAASLRGVEGWVLRYSDGLRVKLKTSEYMELHRLINGLTTKRILEAMQLGSFGEMIRQLPEEFRLKTEAVAAAIEAEVAVREAGLRQIHAEVEADLAASGLSRADEREFMKQYAAGVSRSGLAADDRNILFMLAKGREIRLLLLKLVDPSKYDHILSFGAVAEGEEG